MAQTVGNQYKQSHKKFNKNLKLDGILCRHLSQSYKAMGVWWKFQKD